MTALPAWIDAEAWAGFVEMRLTQQRLSRGKIPWTSRAETLILKELYALRDKGHDANKSLDQSALKGWTDVYAPQDKETPNLNRQYNTSREPEMTEAQRVAAREAGERFRAKHVRRVA
jgi:hypothetical protein